MPTFRTQPSSNLVSSMRSLMSGGDLSPLQSMQADLAAANTARSMGLAEKARLEVEEARRADAARRDPGTTVRYAADTAGIDYPDATQLYKAMTGYRERPPIEQDDEGNRMPDVTYARPENLAPGAERGFRSALASAAAAQLATGKSSAGDVALAADRLGKTRMSAEAAEVADTGTANQRNAAASGRQRQPFTVTSRGVRVNRETGATDESSQLAAAARNELASRSTRNTASAGLSNARAGAAGAGFAKRASPEQVEKWISEVARKEWDLIPGTQRKGMNFQQHLDDVRRRFNGSNKKVDPKNLIVDAHVAIADGANKRAVAARFKQMTGMDLPEPPALGSDDDDDDED